jgi:hypothetical protein
MTLVCELAIIAATFIFLRNEISWQRWLKDAGHSGRSRDKMAMLFLSLVVTACIILLTIIGRGNITNGFKNLWRGVRKVSTIAPSIEPSMLPRLRTFKTFIHPADRDVDPEHEAEAPSEGLHALKSTSVISMVE